MKAKININIGSFSLFSVRNQQVQVDIRTKVNLIIIKKIVQLC